MMYYETCENSCTICHANLKNQEYFKVVSNKFMPFKAMDEQIIGNEPVHNYVMCEKCHDKLSNFLFELGATTEVKK